MNSFIPSIQPVYTANLALACAASDPYVAVRVRARSELVIANTLAARGVEALCPVYMERKAWADRVKLIPSALFPCYIFSRFNANLRQTIVTVPGVQEIVNNGRGPLPIEDRDMDVIKKLTIDHVGSRPFPLPIAGQKVRIDCGPLAGVEGTLVRIKNQTRIVLSIQLLDRAVITEVSEYHVTVL